MIVLHDTVLGVDDRQPSVLIKNAGDSLPRSANHVVVKHAASIFTQENDEEPPKGPQGLLGMYRLRAEVA